MKTLLKLAVGLVLTWCSNNTAQACAACFSGAGAAGENDVVGNALNGSIFLMLGLLGAMFTLIGGAALAIWRRSRQPLPDHVELAESISGAIAAHGLPSTY